MYRNNAPALWQCRGLCILDSGVYYLRDRACPLEKRVLFTMLSRMLARADRRNMETRSLGGRLTDSDLATEPLEGLFAGLRAALSVGSRASNLAALDGIGDWQDAIGWVRWRCAAYADAGRRERRRRRRSRRCATLVRSVRGRMGRRGRHEHAGQCA